MLIYKMTNKEIKSFRRYTKFDRRAYTGLILNISFSLFIIGLIIYCLFKPEEIKEFGNMFYFYSILLMGFPLWTFFYSMETLTKKKCFQNREMYLVRSKLNYIVDRNPTVNVSINLGLFKDDEYNCSNEIPTSIKSKLMTSLNTLYLKVVDRRQVDDIYEFPKEGDCYVVMYLDREKKRCFFDLYTLDFSFLDNLNKKYKYSYTEGPKLKKKIRIDDNLDLDKIEDTLDKGESETISELELNEILEESNDVIKSDVEDILEEFKSERELEINEEDLNILINEISNEIGDEINENSEFLNLNESEDYIDDISEDNILVENDSNLKDVKNNNKSKNTSKRRSNGKKKKKR